LLFTPLILRHFDIFAFAAAIIFDYSYYFDLRHYFHFIVAVSLFHYFIISFISLFSPCQIFIFTAFAADADTPLLMAIFDALLFSPCHYYAIFIFDADAFIITISIDYADTPAAIIFIIFAILR
jgi:hypothetical protein